MTRAGAHRRLGKKERWRRRLHRHLRRGDRARADDRRASAEVVYTIDGDRVQRFTRDGKDPKVFATGFNQPRQIQVNKASGDVYVVNARDRKIVGFDNRRQVRVPQWVSGPVRVGSRAIRAGSRPRRPGR